MARLRGPFPSDTTANGEAAPVSLEGDDEAVETPPPSNKSVWFDRVEVRNVGPIRDGLPDTFCVRRDSQDLRRGSWEICLELVRKLLGDPLPKGQILETTKDDAIWPSLRTDQEPPRPPVPRVEHGRLGHRKRRHG